MLQDEVSRILAAIHAFQRKRSLSQVEAEALARALQQSASRVVANRLPSSNRK